MNQRRSCKSSDGRDDFAAANVPDFEKTQNLFKDRKDIISIEGAESDNGEVPSSTADNSIAGAGAIDVPTQLTSLDHLNSVEAHNVKSETVREKSKAPDDQYEDIVNDPKNKEIIRYICSLASLIEGRRVMADEIRRLVTQKMRQHSMYFWGRFLYRFHARANDPPLK